MVNYDFIVRPLSVCLRPGFALFTSSTGKEQSSWLSACAVVYLMASMVFAFLPVRCLEQGVKFDCIHS